MVNKCTGNKKGDGEGHGCFHTNFDISENVSELCSNDLGQIGGPGPGGAKQEVIQFREQREWF